MKKIKVMLMTFCVFAVVGGALAFKSTKNNFTTLFTTAGQSGHACNVELDTYTTNSGGTLINATTKSTTSTDCGAQIRTTTGEQ